MTTWSPWRHLREWYPDVQIRETELHANALGCMDHKRRMIWLRSGLSFGQQRATLAYQVGQFEFGPFDPDRGDGGMVNDWASRLLIPFQELLRAFRRLENLPDVAEEAMAELAEELVVDVAMITTRLAGLSDPEWDLLKSARRAWLDAE